MGKIGASRTGVIGETPYEYLRGKSQLEAKRCVRGSVRFRVRPRGRLASRHVVAGPRLLLANAAHVHPLRGRRGIRARTPLTGVIAGNAFRRAFYEWPTTRELGQTSLKRGLGAGYRQIYPGVLRVGDTR